MNVVWCVVFLLFYCDLAKNQTVRTKDPASRYSDPPQNEDWVWGGDGADEFGTADNENSAKTIGKTTPDSETSAILSGTTTEIATEKWTEEGATGATTTETASEKWTEGGSTGGTTTEILVEVSTAAGITGANLKDSREIGATTKTVTPSLDETTVGAVLTVDACEGKPEAIDFSITTNSFNVSMVWVPPSDGCVTEYVIYLDRTEVARTEETKYTIENLMACSNYTIGLAVSYNAATSDITKKTINTAIPIPFEYEVNDFLLTEHDDTLTATWEMDELVVSCVTTYSLVWWDENNHQTGASTPDFIYNINPIVGCMKYTMQNIPQVDPTVQGILAITNHTASPYPTNPPEEKLTTPGKTSARLTWAIDEYAVNQCEINKITVTCEALADENENHSWIIVKPPPKVVEIEDSPSRPRIETIIDGLSEFTNYTCYGVVTNTGGDSLKSSPVKFTTKVEVPSQPTSLEVVATSTTLNLTWQEPVKVPGVMLKYGIYVDNVAPQHYVGDQCLNRTDFAFVVEADNYQFFFETAFPDYLYTVSVYGIVEGAGTGEATIKNATTSTAAPNAPIDLQSYPYVSQDITKYDAVIDMMWEAPCNTNGPLEGFKLVVKAANLEDQTYSIPKNTDESDTLYECNITSVQPYTTYEITIFAVLEDGTEGLKAKTEVLSPEGYPGPPILVEVGSATTTSFESFWKEPEQKMGNITQYNVTVKSLGPIHEVPDDPECFVNTETYDFEVGPSEYNHTFIQGLANYNYNVTVTAKTEIGFGNCSNELGVSTKTAEPDPVRHPQSELIHANTEEYDEVATIQFQPPCNLNGVLKEYQLSYVGSREGFEDDIGETITHDTIANLTKLKADYNYKVTITVATTDFRSETLSFDFHSNPGVPPHIQGIEAPEAADTTTAKFHLKKSVFNNTFGEMLYFALIIVPKTDGLVADNYGFWEDGVWPPLPQVSDSSQKPYHIKEKFWNPFESGQESVDVVIGADEECSGDFCNKPLEEGTDYALIVRALTKTTYRDSAPLNFQTVADPALDLGLILGLVFGLLAAAILIIFIIILWRRKKRTLVKKETIRTSSTDPAPIDVKKFVAHYEFLKENYNVLKAQFTILGTKSKDITLPITYALLPENKRKNRYSNILPYDETRVKLHIDEDDEIGSDYINASYIKGYSGDVEYIATQGPLESTCKDFWKMVIQENVSIIVMVSQFVEQGKEKCHRYIPSNHETVSLAENFDVRCTTELHFGTYCVRTLQVKKDVVQRTVIHMQFLEWPDFGVPQGTDNMLQFCCQMRERVRAEGGIIVVHCSAGVGRTGTLISTDMLLQTIDDRKDIDIFKTVLDLRKQRTTMVQTEKQYMFIHSCLRDSLEAPEIQPYTPNEEPLYENLNVIKTSLDDESLLPNETESAL